MKKEKEPNEENEEQPKKGGKKKLLIPLIAIVVVALAAAVVLLVLPRFGINLLGGGEKKNDAPPKDELEVYTLGEETAAALDSVLEEGDGELIAVRNPDKKKDKKEDKDGDASSSGSGSSEASPAEDVDRFIYFYELNSPSDVVNRYLDVMLGGEQGFSLVDAEYVIQEERPELEDAAGSLVLARNSTAQEGCVFQVSVGWSEANDNLAIRVSAPAGKVYKPEPKPKPEAASLDEHMDQLMAMNPSELGLSGTSMDEYEIYAMGGFVKVDDLDCRRFTIYSRESPGSIAGIFLISSDKKHFFQLDQVTGGVTELR